MYQVLLADDEPIILSGLQSMLDWGRLGCAVAGTARNGKQALDLIERCRPDIVVCDINMPVLSGLRLLEVCAERYPEVVFIMLTNHQDFHMAQQSLRGRAVDYLLKIDLDEEKLEHSMKLAITEREKRRRLSENDGNSLGRGPTPANMIQLYVRTLLSVSDGPDQEQAVAGLGRLGADRRCAVVLLHMDPARVPDIGTFSAQERARLFSFHRSLVEDAAQKFFQGQPYVLSEPAADNGIMTFFFWDVKDTALIDRFRVKLSNTLGGISQVQISFLVTGILSGQELPELRMQLDTLQREFELCPRPLILYSECAAKTDYVTSAKRYVDSHILERVLVQDVAAAIGITPNYLSSLFKRQLGQNFMDYVNATKIKYACSLLKDGKHFVYEVSHMLGYDNAYYFTKVFKRYMKITPKEYQTRAAMQEDASRQLMKED